MDTHYKTRNRVFFVDRRSLETSTGIDIDEESPPLLAGIKPGPRSLNKSDEYDSLSQKTNAGTNSEDA